MDTRSTEKGGKSFETGSGALFALELERLVKTRRELMGKVLRPELLNSSDTGIADGRVFEKVNAETGKKFDAGKAPVAQGFDAYFPKAKAAVANVSKFGKEKYSVEYADKNWMRVEGGAGRYEDALGRHSDAHVSGELYADDSKLLHAAHRAWNAMATLELLLRSGVKERLE